MSNYTQKELIGMLKTIQGIYSYRWNRVREIVSKMSEIKVVSKKWGNFNKIEYYPLDLSKIDTWSTHDNKDCISLFFYIENESLLCKAKINDGESYDGRFKRHRFTALLELPIDFINSLSASIESKFNAFLDEEYEKHLKSQKYKWVSNVRVEFMNFYNSSESKTD